MNKKALYSAVISLVGFIGMWTLMDGLFAAFNHTSWMTEFWTPRSIAVMSSTAVLIALVTYIEKSHKTDG